MNSTPDRHIDDEQLLDLLNDLTPAGEAADARRHIEACHECEARFVRLAREHETLRARAPAVVGGGTERKRNSIATRTRVLAAAAVVVAAVVVAVLAPRLARLPANDSATYWMPAEPELVTLRTRDSNDRLRILSSGIEAYERHRLDEAVRLLRDVDAEAPNDQYKIIANLYLASALVNMRKYDEAVSSFPMIDLEYLPYRWRQQARWILFNAHEALGHEQEALELLEPLLDDSGDLGQRARAARARRTAG